MTRVAARLASSSDELASRVRDEIEIHYRANVPSVEELDAHPDASVLDPMPAVRQPPVRIYVFKLDAGASRTSSTTRSRSCLST
jgi:hypothetical protein